MAHLLFIPNKENSKGALCHIAADDTKKTQLAVNEASFKVLTCTTDEFNKIRHNEADVTYSGNTITVTDINTASDWTYVENAEGLQSVIDIQIDACEKFLNSFPNHAWAADVTTYRNYCTSFDTSSITYPMTKTWERHLTDSGVSFFSVLELK